MVMMILMVMVMVVLERMVLGFGDGFLGECGE